MSIERVPQRVLQWLPHARAAELVYGVDPLLLLAIMDRESNGGESLQPRGPTGKGDRGAAHGLMQIDQKYHGSFLAALGPDGRPLWCTPAFNVLYGAAILFAGIHEFDGEGCNPMITGIARYNAGSVRIREVLRSVTRPIADSQLVQMLDPLTTASKAGGPGDYVSDVLRRRKSYVLST